MKNAMLQILAIFIALSSFFCSFAAAEQREKGVLPKHEDFPALVMTGTVTLEHVIDGLHFSVSTSDGQDVQTVRLSGIHIPGIDGNSPSAEAEKAKTLWHELLRAGKTAPVPDDKCAQRPYEPDGTSSGPYRTRP